MNANDSVVAFDAAMMRSPSFSRSSSSTTTTMRPAAISAIAWSMVSKVHCSALLTDAPVLVGANRQQALHVLRNHIDFKVDRVAHSARSERRQRERRRN